MINTVSAVSLGLVILAGGRSSRMGRDKAALPWRGATLLTDLLLRSQAVAFDEIVVSANRPPDLSALPPELTARIRVVADDCQDCGPLGGMEASFRACSCSYCLVLSVDLPFYDFSPVKQILPKLAQMPPVDLFLPMSESRPQPLAAVYRRGPALEAVQAALNAGKRRVLSIADALTVRILDDAGAPILYENVNTPSAYKAALAIDANRRRAVPIVSLSAARSGDGKTSLAAQVIAELTRRGYAVAYVKSTHHRRCREKKGSDTDRALQAGAVQALLCGPDDVAAGEGKEDALLRLTQQTAADIAIVESRSHGLFPVLYLTNDAPPIRQHDVTAIIGNISNADAACRWFSPDQLDALCSYILYVTTS
ncbi:molybdopterin-guanine dinucleotide biosynthesis protein MobB [Megasphaera sp. An286]|uniref:molybdopterin-guanine dinucleotide biosynthesis protein MobB n=1 Tax=Megasphaera sp. An286 TaxID=1965622 RepID=UPI001302B9D0|nr:molybdopterin-guanine dinucleotide biosynthesis protein MobB [Megasphaera sp. An286]